MNRAQRTKEELEKQLRLFESYSNMRDSKEAFFSAVARYRTSVVALLKKKKLFSQTNIQTFDAILANIDTMKSKGHDKKVYWSRVGPEFDKAKTMLCDLIHQMDDVKVPLHYLIQDYFSDRTFVQGVFVGVTVSLIVWLIIQLISIFM